MSAVDLQTRRLDAAIGARQAIEYARTLAGQRDYRRARVWLEIARAEASLLGSLSLGADA